MKKLLVSLLAIAGMVACTNDEVVSVQQGNPIAFDTFVENTTRVGYDSTNLPEGFNVWAFIENTNGRSTILEAEDVERQGDQYVYGNTQYWVPGNTYYFAALAPKDSQNVTNLDLATGDAAKKGLGTFNFDNDNGTEDLIYAVNKVVASETTSKVTFTFKHLLSKVKFSFTNTFDNANYSIEVRDIAMTVPMSGTVNLAADELEWTPGSTSIGLAFGETGIIAQSGVDNSAERLTIPAGEDQVYGVTFKVDLYVGNGANKVLAKTYEKSSTISGIEFEAGKAYNFAAAINAESLALNEVIFDASVDGWDSTTTVQLIDTPEKFVEAIEDPEVDRIILDGDINLDDLFGASTLSTRAGANSGLVIPAGRTLTLDLNGHKISHEKECTASYEMIKNLGNLTITGNGTISFKDTGAGDPNYGWGSYTIRNEGTLTVENGTIEHLGEQDAHMICAIFQYSGHSTINGGKISTPNYRSARLWSGDMTINGGEFEGQLWLQAVNDTSDLTINGGTFAPRGGDSSSVFVSNSGYSVKFAVNGGHFTTKIGMSEPFGCITGGTFTTAAKEGTNIALVNDDYDWVEHNGNWTLALKNVIAKIGEVEYRTLQKAFDAVDNGTIQLVGDVTLVETATLAEGKTATLDLNGKTITHADEKNKYAINNLGTLTITGNGTVNSRGIYNGYGNGEANVTSAKLTIVNGTFNAKGENGGAAVFNYGTVDIQGGSFTSIGGYSLNNQNGSSMTIADGVNANNGVYTSSATLTINGGEISGNRSGCHVIYCWNAKITINGGSFYNNNSGNSTVMAAGTTTITYNGGTYGIKDGRVPGNGNTWTSCLLDSSNSATAVINGGTYNGGFRVQAGTSMTINGGSFNDCYGSNYNIYGTATVKGGTYTDAAAIAFAKKYVAEGCEATETNGVLNVRVLPVAKIGETEYATLQEAFNVGGDITLLCNVTVAETVTLAEGKTAVLDLKGKKILGGLQTDTSKHIYPFNIYGSLTINDSSANGSIEGRGIYVQTGSKLIVNGGSIYGIDSNGGSAIWQYGGDITINGGLIEQKAEGTYNFAINGLGGTVTVTGGKIAGNHGAIATAATEVVLNDGEFVCTGTTGMTDNVLYSYNSGTIIINGGTFTADNDVPAGGCCVYDANGGVTINGGVFGNSSGGDVWGTTGTTIKGGKFENLIETSHIAEGYEMNANGEVVAK